MLRTTKIRLYPTDAQRSTFAAFFGCARFVYNEALSTNKETYLKTGRGNTKYFDLVLRLPKLKQEHEWLRRCDSQVLQCSLQHLSRAYENFFAKRAELPNFKSKHHDQSISYPQRVKLDGNKLYCPKVGWVNCVVHRPISGSIKTVTISRNACNQFHASILTDDGLPELPIITPTKLLGIDVGLNDLVVTSNGSKFNNPRFLKKHAKNLARKQQKLSRAKKGSKKRNKARLKVARVHLKIANTRKDFLHKLSHRLVSENQGIAVETLNVKGMMKNHNLAKSIADVSWGMLGIFLEYKCKRECKPFVKCDRFFPSSKLCNHCGHRTRKMDQKLTNLDIRSWTCEECKEINDRDENAAKNIADEGLRQLLEYGTYSTALRGSIRPEVSVKKPKARAVEKGSPLLLAVG